MITCPSEDQQRTWAAWIEAREPPVTQKFGFIDGKNYRVASPSNRELQNALYNGCLHSVLVTDTLAFGANGCVIWIKHNCSGSWNDGDTSRQFREKLRDRHLTFHDYGVLADSVFPVSGDMSGRIVTPLKDGDMERAVAWAGDELSITTLNNAVISIRQEAEWGMGAVEKVVRRLLLACLSTLMSEGVVWSTFTDCKMFEFAVPTLVKSALFFRCWREKSVKNMTTCLRFMVYELNIILSHYMCFQYKSMAMIVLYL